MSGYTNRVRASLDTGGRLTRGDMYDLLEYAEDLDATRPTWKTANFGLFWGYGCGVFTGASLAVMIWRVAA